MHIKARKSPLPPPQQAPNPTHPDARPLRPHPQPPLQLLGASSDQHLGGRLHSRRHEGHRVVLGGGSGISGSTGGIRPDRRRFIAVDHHARDQRRGHMARFEPVAVEVEEAVIGPVAGGQEEDEEQDGAVDARSVEEVGR